MLVSIPVIISVCFVSQRLGDAPTSVSIKKASYMTMTAKDPHPANDRSGYCNLKSTRHLTNRRDFILKPLVLASLLTIDPIRTNAACLPGDVRSDCIGIYKLPLDDAVLGYVETPEQLKKYAPDLNWVSICYI